ncbi:MAG TPA: ornithine--oxo-acid transaminase [Myxococcales bacterium]|nr:ornithine--oxo-acid transaminase [Deltaproteobacteria bacterium]HAA59272.1 ornithine--oxo-acid transaminase [Myxococcales bacterium]|tara:strand:+ start:8006 stop:9214 length:1209 start_codon:yes stop_codon:yes gene_type:complete
MSKTADLIEQVDQYSAHHYHPLPIVIERAEGCWVHDVEGGKFMDMLSAYSALNHGHRHPRILEAMKKQLDKVTLTSRAFHNDQIGPFSEQLAKATGLGMSLPMNSGAEAVETALKLARKWGHVVKGIPKNTGEIIVCDGNFHGRTISIISFSTEPKYKGAFGPFTPGFKSIPYGDSDALAQAITPETAAFLVEPIQGEGGVIVPPEGYMKRVRELCDKHNVLLIADEIQTGLGRTGKMFCCEYDDVKPDILIMGKALGGGVYPISAISSEPELMLLFGKGEHGSTFGGNPLGCAVATEALRIIEDEGLVARSYETGEIFRARLSEMASPLIKEIRGRGLLIGVEIKEEYGPARPFCEALMSHQILCKETHESVLRFAPPLGFSADELDWAMERIEKVLKNAP